MICKQNTQIWVVLIPLILVIFMLSACGPKKVNLWGDPATGLILTYRLPEGQVLKYSLSGGFLQSFEVMGQVMEVESISGTDFTVKSKGQKEGNLQLDVTIDSMEVNVSSPEGEMTPDTSPVVGKNFEIILSPIGKELELIGADEIKYEGLEGEMSIESSFKFIFPDVADKPVKIGDTWTTEWTDTTLTSSSEIQTQFTSLNTFEGFETVDGFECVKIKADITGLLEIEQEQQGMQMIGEGEIEGTDIWYFAYKEGVYVKSKSEGTADITINISAQNMTIPVTRVYYGELKLIK